MAGTTTNNGDRAPADDGVPSPLVRLRKRLAQTQYGRRALGSLVAVDGVEHLYGVTFDDGPHPDVTPRVLELLAARKSTATFFMPAERVLRYPDLARAVVAGGNEVGVHGFTHTRITELGPSGVRHETAQARREITRVIGTRPRWFRPPYGAQNMRTFLATRAQGMDIAVWAVDPSDAMTTRGFEIANNERGTLTLHAAGAPMSLDAGRVLLLHDTPAGDDSDGSVSESEAADRKVNLIERLLDGIVSVGGRTATLTELLSAGVGSRRIWRSAGY